MDHRSGTGNRKYIDGRLMERFLRIGLGLGLLWYGILRGAQGLVVRLNNYTFRSIDLAGGTVSLNLNLLVKNPLVVGLLIKGVIGDVYAQGFKVGTVNTLFDYYLAGGKTHILPVIVDLNMMDVGQAALLNIQSGDIRSLSIAFNGKMYVGSWKVAIPLQFELDHNDLLKR